MSKALAILTPVNPAPLPTNDTALQTPATVIDEMVISFALLILRPLPISEPLVVFSPVSVCKPVIVLTPVVLSIPIRFRTPVILLVGATTLNPIVGATIFTPIALQTGISAPKDGFGKLTLTLATGGIAGFQ